MRAQNNFMWLTLASSGSTLVCCALPALLVSLGAGAAVASLVSTFPFLIWMSQHKTALFVASGLMMLAAWWWRRQPAACPLEPELARACARYKRISDWVFRFSVAVYAVGVFFAYILPWLLYG